NLPTTPVTDLKVHRNDLVISTMGRSAYIMDNITPLQQLAAIVNDSGTANQYASARVPAFSMARSSRLSMAALFEQPSASSADLPPVMLFAPQQAIRMRNSTAAASPASPEYPAPSAQ